MLYPRLCAAYNLSALDCVQRYSPRHLLFQISQTKLFTDTRASYHTLAPTAPSTLSSFFRWPCPFPSLTLCSSANPKLRISSTIINPFSILHCRYALLSMRHSSAFSNRAAFRQDRYRAICGLHSASWSSGKEPFSGLGNVSAGIGRIGIGET